MELSRETKMELLRDCTAEELQEAIDSKTAPAPLPTSFVVEDKAGCQSTVKITAPSYRHKQSTDWISISFEAAYWKWDVAGIDSLIEGLTKLRDKMVP